MRLIKVVYNNESTFILDILKSIPEIKYLETYNVDHYKEKKRAIPILARHGTKNVPLIVFEDENLQEVSAIWSEQNPDWKSEILKNLK